MLKKKDIDKEQSKVSLPGYLDNSKSRPILIIDDDAWIARVIGSYVRSFGFNPISTSDPVEGIISALEMNPLIIFLDIFMPDIGQELPPDGKN